MSWKDVVEMPASTFVEYMDEVKIYDEDLKKKNGKHT